MKTQKFINRSVSLIALVALVFSFGIFLTSQANAEESVSMVTPSASIVAEVNQTDSDETSESVSVEVSVSTQNVTEVKTPASGSASGGSSSGSGSSSKTTLTSHLNKLKNLDQIDSRVIKILKDGGLGNGGHTNSSSVLGNTECLKADFNDDGVVDSRDVIAFLNAWNAGDDLTDMNLDGDFDQDDVNIFLAIWQDCVLGLGQMCYAPDNLGIINRTALDSFGLQTALDDYADYRNLEAPDAFNDQINYQIWRMNVSGVLSSLDLGFVDADWNTDETVNTLDMVAYLNDWSATNDVADMTGDEEVDAMDFHVFFNLWKIYSVGENIVLDNSQMEVELVSHSSTQPIVFGYYLNGDLESFIPLFKIGSHGDYPEVPEISSLGAIDFTPAYFSNGEFTRKVGFAIDVQGDFDSSIGGFESKMFATERILNSDLSIQALVYDFTQDEFILAFEDTELLGSSDYDFDDLVVRITSKTCEAGGLEIPTLESPDNESFVKGDSLTSMWSKVQGTITYLYQRFADASGMIFVLQNESTDEQITHENLDEQVFWWRVKAVGSGGQSGWSELWKVTVDNTAPSLDYISIASGQSFVDNIPVSGVTVDNWNVDLITFSQSDYSGGECNAFAQVGSIDTLDNLASTTWNYDWNPGSNGNFCFKAEGIDLAGNVESGSLIEDITFSTSGSDNGGDDGSGGGSGGGGYYGGGSGGRVLGAFTDIEDLQRQVKALQNELLGLLEQRLLSIQGQLGGLSQASFLPEDDGQVLGAIAQAQEIPEEDSVSEEEVEQGTVVGELDDSLEDTGVNKTMLWILFIIILLILLFLVFKKKKKDQQ